MGIPVDFDNDFLDTAYKLSSTIEDRLWEFLEQICQDPNSIGDEIDEAVHVCALGGNWVLGWVPILSASGSTSIDVSHRYERIVLHLEWQESFALQALPYRGQPFSIYSDPLSARFAEPFLQAMPAWATIMDSNAESNVWCNRACAELFERSQDSLRSQERSGLFDEQPRVEHRGPGRESYRILLPSGGTKDVCGWFERFAFAVKSDTSRYIGDLTFNSEWLISVEWKFENKELPAYIQVSSPPASPSSESAYNPEVLAAYLRNLRTAALIKDLNGRIVWYNREFETLVLRLTDIREPCYQKSSAEVFDLDDVEAGVIKQLESLVIDSTISVMARETVRGISRDTLRFPIYTKDYSSVEFIGVVSTDLAPSMLSYEED